MARSSQKSISPLLDYFKKTYPESHCSLHFETPFQLAVATILSAQCTDARVNQVTPDLFKKFPTPQAMAKAKLSELEKLVRTTGFYKNKARSLLEMSRSLVANHGGEIPRTLEELIALRGIGRKTANVILGVAFGISAGIVVDTHVGRLSRRLGLTREKDPIKVERDLVKVVPQENWIQLSHWMIDHGRAQCLARSPRCETCGLKEICPRVGLASKT